MLKGFTVDIHQELSLGLPRGGGCPRRLNSHWFSCACKRGLNGKLRRPWLAAEFETRAGTFADFRPAPQVISRSRYGLPADRLVTHAHER